LLFFTESLLFISAFTILVVGLVFGIFFVVVILIIFVITFASFLLLFIISSRIALVVLSRFAGLVVAISLTTERRFSNE
jgi:hypothetical protein